MINNFHCVSDGYPIKAWVNAYPPGAPGPVVEEDTDYGGYCAKPFALKDVMDEGTDIGILLDASFWPIRHIGPLVDEIVRRGYYMAPDGFVVGQWISDRMLSGFGLSRDETMSWAGCASGCVGLDFRNNKCRELLNRWCAVWDLFPGHHSNRKAETQEFAYRNVGHVSDDPRCLGHRHDQSALGVIAHQLGMDDYRRPRLTAYDCDGASEATVLVCRGGL